MRTNQTYLLFNHSPPPQLTKVARHQKVKGNGNGRTYTSKFRGVHQTFPTKRWEAQFRRNGKPTSLGCFDNEEEAARAYDKMMIWCEIHHATGVKGGITNFDQGEYQADIPLLQEVTQVWLCDGLAGAWCGGCRSGDVRPCFCAPVSLRASRLPQPAHASRPQDELVQILRSDGRRQAAQRMLKQKRDSQGSYGSHGAQRGAMDTE